MTAREKLFNGINWKFYNFLKDSITKYEDEGYTIVMFVLYTKEGTYRDRNKLALLKYYDSTEKQLHANSSDEELEEYLRIGGDYLYEFDCQNVNGEISQNIHEDFYNRIKSKCTLVDYVGVGVFTVKPN